MATEASKRLHDASILSSTAGLHSDSAYLLELLAFELLLKATVRIYGHKPPRNHSYCQLFDNLPPEVRDRVRQVSAARMSTAANYSDVHLLLETWSKNFVDLRYPYERYKGMTEDEYHARGKEWLARGAPEAEAEFRYNPSELHGMIFALERELQTWLDQLSP